MNGFLVCCIISLVIYSILYNWTYLFLFLLTFGSYLLLAWFLVPQSKFNSILRKLSIACWSDPDSPECIGHIKIKMSNALRYIDDFHKKTGKKLTITQFVLKPLADILAQNPDITGKLVFGYYVPYETIDIGCLVALEGGNDLSFICISEADKKSYLQIWEECQKKVESVRTGEALKLHKKSTTPFKLLPTALGGIAIEICSYLAIPLGIDLKAMGISKHPCGTMVITNIGSGGVEIGYAPFPSVMRVPGILTFSSIREEAIVNDGKIVVEPILTIMFGLDHRFGDGTKGIRVINNVKNRLENPHEAYPLD